MKELDVQIIKLFAAQDGFLSGAQLSKSLGVSRTAIWKQINSLRKQGYQIEASPGQGYKLIHKPDRLTSSEIKAILETQLLGNKVIYLEATDSTNDIAKEHGKIGTKEGLLVVAERQNQGRGRRGRNWHSEPGGLYFSLLLRPRLSLMEVSTITLLVAVSIVQVLRSDYQLAAQIKWPNDILVNNRKLCGILTELSADPETINYLVLGIGLNCNTKLNDWPAEIQAIATSLSNLLGHQIQREKLLNQILVQLEANYLAFINNNFAKLLPLARKFSCLLGKTITINTHEQTYTAKAIDISADGSLLIEKPDGQRCNLWAADVSVRQ